ncbi:mandelate racemase/muconate lactonizing enzyme family protein [Lacisediminimonas profundi]|uniref:mandelate racemase/muconate lactonizing enzyme family protein n=1 Tax=Lacisediminimonas profundi TaxID=2603856 RepID=UPI00124B7CA8|nr:enolase C-terminal domain-like protein [Lacisediminimonas profundi]
MTTNQSHGSETSSDWSGSDRYKAGIIRSLELIPLWLPFKTNFKIAAGAPRQGINVMILKIHTESGLVGIGETHAWMRQGSRETFKSIESIIVDHYSPRLIGRSIFDHQAIIADLKEAVWNTNYPMAAVADAMLDLQGKILGVPAYQILGGRAKTAVAAGITLGIMPDNTALLSEVEQRVAEGYSSFTVKVGNDPERDAKAVEFLAKAMGDRIIIRADGNSGMDMAGAMRFMNRVQHLGLDAVEQLLPPWDLAGMAELASRYNVPIMADECVSSDTDLIKVITMRAASVFQTKIAKNGGAWSCKKLWEIGSAAGMRIFPGNHPGASVATASAVHLATSWPGDLLEGPLAVGVNEILAEDIVTEPILRKGKYMYAPEKPGLGVTLDEEKIKRFRVDKK